MSFKGNDLDEHLQSYSKQKKGVSGRLGAEEEGLKRAKLDPSGKEGPGTCDLG